MIRALFYRPDSLKDLDEVETYTKRTWSDAQAKRYAAKLVSDIKALSVSAFHNPLYNEAYIGLRRKRSGMHHIYYLVSDDFVDVLNIIHVQRDPGLHLKMEAWKEPEGTG